MHPQWSLIPQRSLFPSLDKILASYVWGQTRASSGTRMFAARGTETTEVG